MLSTMFILSIILSSLSIAVATTVEYDYVIIGGGTASCAIAARLCSNLQDATVAVLERGTPRTLEENFQIQPANNVYGNWDIPSLVQRWESEINPNIALVSPFNKPILNDKGELQFGRKTTILTGNTIGGSTAISAGQWTTPTLREITDWGIHKLDNANALRLLNKAKTTVKTMIPPPSFRQNYSLDWLESANTASNYTEIDEVVEFQTTFDHTGKRRSSYESYLLPAMEGLCAKTLTVIQDATVIKLVSTGKKISRVEYVSTTSGNVTDVKSISAKLEVIVSAGPYGSPHLLLLSGIGPKPVLEAVGITQIANLPVGSNTQARPLAGITSFYAGMPLDWSNDPSIKTPQAREQFEKGNGGIYAVGIVQVGATLKEGYIEATFSLPAIAGGVNILYTLCLLNPTSRGNMSLINTSPFTPLSIFQNLLGTEEDRINMEICVQKVRAIHEAFPQNFLMSNISPEPNVALSDYIPYEAKFSHHFVGGCAVNNVVDSYLKLIGYENVRVVDASVLPSIPKSAGPMTSVYMLAELAAELIINEYNNDDNDNDCSDISVGSGSRKRKIKNNDKYKDDEHTTSQPCSGKKGANSNGKKKRSPKSRNS